MMRFFLLITIGFPFAVNGQSFLLNGSFEDENTCSEYSVECAPEAWQTNYDGFHNYFKNSNLAHSGSNCMAIEAGDSRKPYTRTFIRSQLVCGLRKGGQYQIDLFVKSSHPILDSIGIYFTAYDPLYDNRVLQNISPTLYLNNNNSFEVHDTVWQKVHLNYTANGEESFVSIGNFCKRDITGPTGIPLESKFFVFIDDVSLTPLDNREKLCDDWLSRKQEIYDQDERHWVLRKKIKEAKEKPLQPVILTPASLVIVDTLTLPDVLFASGKAQLQKSADSVLNEFSKKMIGHAIDSIVVEGHTGNKGTNELNEKLSFARAQAVGNYFIANAIIKPSGLVVRGWASRKPVADNNTADGRQKNRRVEIFVYTK